MLTVKANRKGLLGNEHVYDSVLVELAGFHAYRMFIEDDEIFIDENEFKVSM